MEERLERPLIPRLTAVQWRALAASWLAWLFDGFENFALVLAAPMAMRELLAPEQAPQTPIYIGGLLSATLIGWATGGVLAGILTDYIGRRRMLLLTIAWYSISTGLTALSPSYWFMLFFRFLVGLGLGGEWGPGTAIVAEFWPPHLRGRAAAALQSAFGFGFLLATVVWVFVSQLGPSAWRVMFLLGILPALLVLYIRTGISDPGLWVRAAERRREIRRRLAAGEAVPEEERKAVRFTLAYILAEPTLRRRVILLLLMSLSTIVGWWSVSTWVPQYGGQVAARHGLNPGEWASATALAYNVGGIIGYLLVGVFADLVGRKPTFVAWYALALAMVMVLFGLVSEPSWLLLAAAVNGVFTLGQFSWMPIYLAESFPTAARGTGISLVFDSTRYLAAAGPFVAGYLITALGGIGSAAMIMGLVYVLGLVATPFAGPETKGKPLPD
jgi:MFS family permease